MINSEERTGFATLYAEGNDMAKAIEASNLMGEASELLYQTKNTANELDFEYDEALDAYKIHHISKGNAIADIETARNMLARVKELINSIN